MTKQSRTGASSDLTPLFEFSNVVNASIDLKFILSTVLLTVMGKMLVARGLVLLRREGDKFEVVAAKGLSDLEGVTTQVRRAGKGMIALGGIKKTSTRHDFFKQHELRLLVPIVAHGDVVGLLALGEKLSRKKYTEADRNLIQSLVNLSASAVEKGIMLEHLRIANRNLDRKYQELNTLFDLSKGFNLILDAQKVIRLLTFSLLGQVGVNRYAVCLVRSGSMQIVASRIEEHPELHRAVQRLVVIRNPQLTQELRKSSDLKEAVDHLESANVRAIIPMQVQNQMKGLILLGEKLNGEPYSKGDLEFLYSLANLAIISIENARLFQETLEKQRMEDELNIAREIQQGLLPRRLPELEGFDLAAVNVSSKAVGGDYYDIIELPDGDYVIAIGDVSGKGTPAALLMANVQAALRALAPMDYSMPEATARLNDLTCSNTGGDKFITLFWGILDVRGRTLRYVNAGHSLPFLVRADGTIERLAEGGIILGMMKTVSPYLEGRATMGSGDLLFLFTDGVSEAMNSAGEDFTEERLEALLRNHAGSSARGIVEAVQREVEQYAGGTPQSDDLTMLVLRVI